MAVTWRQIASGSGSSVSIDISGQTLTNPNKLVVVLYCYEGDGRPPPFPGDGWDDEGNSPGDTPRMRVYRRVIQGNETTVSFTLAGGSADWVALLWEDDDLGARAQFTSGSGTAPNYTTGQIAAGDPDNYVFAFYANPDGGVDDWEAGSGWTEIGRADSSAERLFVQKRTAGTLFPTSTLTSGPATGSHEYILIAFRPLPPEPVPNIPGPLVKVAAKAGSEATSTEHTATFDGGATAEAGNLLVATFFETGGEGQTIEAPEGWTPILDPVGWDGGSERLTVQYWKEADGTETGITINTGLSAASVLVVAEYAIKDFTVVASGADYGFSNGTISPASEVGDLVIATAVWGFNEHEPTYGMWYTPRDLVPEDGKLAASAGWRWIALQDRIVDEGEARLEPTRVFTAGPPAAPDTNLAGRLTVMVVRGTIDGGGDPGVEEVTGSGSVGVEATGTIVAIAPGTYGLDVSGFDSFEPPVGAFLRLIGTTTADACWVEVVQVDGTMLYVVDAEQPGDDTLATVYAGNEAVEVRYHTDPE